MDISDLFKFNRMSIEERFDYMKYNPDEVCDMIKFAEEWIRDGWMKRNGKENQVRYNKHQWLR